MKNALLAILALSGMGCGGSTGSTSTQAPTSFSVHDLVVGPGLSNVLKGMTVAVDETRREAFVAGIMTDHIAVVDLDSKTVTRTFSLTHLAYTVRSMTFDSTHRRLWVVSMHGDRVWIADPDAGIVLAELDTTSDTPAGAPEWPVFSWALDGSRETMYVARGDGGSQGGGRVVTYRLESSLAKTGEVLLDQNVRALRWDPARDSLIALTAPAQTAGSVLILPQGGETQMTSFAAPKDDQKSPPNLLALAPDGDFYVAGSSLWRVQPTGAIAWSVTLTLPSVHAIESLDAEVAVLHKYGTANLPDMYVSRLASYQASSGQAIATRKVRFEGSRMTAGAGLYVVGNGGDASVSLLPTGSAEGTTVKVGASAEDVALTPDGRLLILNRLGGSQLAEFPLSSGQGRTVTAGDWPMRMAMRPAEDKLFVLSHFESALHVLRLSDLSPTTTISLELPASITDSVADFAFDPEGALLAALICEQGKVVIVDGSTNALLATVTLGDSAPNYGPGRMSGAVDTSGNRVFVYLEDAGKIFRLDGASGFQVGASATVSVNHETRTTYAFLRMYFSPSLNRLFAFDQVLDPDTLAVVGTISGVHRVVGEGEGVLYAQRRTTAGDEYLITLDSQTWNTTEERYLFNAEVMSSYVAFDVANSRAAFTHPAQSTAMLVDLR